MWIAKRCKVFTFACPQLGTSWCQAVEHSSFGMEGTHPNWSPKSPWFLMRKSDISFFLLVGFVFNPPQDSSAPKTLQTENQRGKLILQSDCSDSTRSHSRTEVCLLCSRAEFPPKTDFLFFSELLCPVQLPRSWQAVSCSMICESRRARCSPVKFN